ncbi:WXG100 family type VII secretion target [Streptomyces sp. Z26]|uniref:WXG100 family type VII secretion target n=1 Tax=Streptomyces sp. Z26 TaxID=2500177 RepID=UPI000FCAC2C3|nr:WXG100 family type VII secretion target [Streptomyces sp. Z26]
MGDNDNPPPQDALAERQLLFTDLRRMVAPFFGQQSFGDNKETAFNKTSFDGFDLNDLVDLVDNAKPDDMEAVGNALYQAAEKIEQVGIDLAKHIEGVPWEGEAGEAFRKWGGDLAKNTKKLGTFTGSAGVQIKAAGIGLTEVRSAMPPRDDGGVGPKVADIKSPARVKSNPDFVKAEKVDAAKRESVRQEAIIQMDKLSSYYQVSHDTMYAAEEPMFKPMPTTIPVPKPSGKGSRFGLEAGWSDQSSARQGVASSASEPRGAESFSGGGGHEVGAASAGLGNVASPIVHDQHVGTEIDSVEAPSAPTVGEATTRPVGPNGPAGPHSMPTAGPLINAAPVRHTGPKPPSVTGSPRPMAPPGRPDSAGPLGRAPTAATGPIGRPVTPTTPQPSGRNGIVGGQPISRTGQTAGSSRFPSGTVVGNETTGRAPMGRSPMIPGGGNASTPGAAHSGRRLTSTPGGIVGSPRSSVSGQGGQTFTPGGTGLVRRTGADSRNAIGAAPRSQIPSGPKREDSRRPDYLVEDTEAWTTGRRDSAPPVVE